MNVGGHQRKLSNSTIGRSSSPLMVSQQPSMLIPSPTLQSITSTVSPTGGNIISLSLSGNSHNIVTSMSGGSIPTMQSFVLDSSNTTTTLSNATSSNNISSLINTPNIQTPLQSQSTTPSLVSSNINSNNNNNSGSPPVTTTNNNTIQPPPKTKGANVEVYGFVYWIATFVGYAIYLLWAFIPESVLSDLGVHYYPSKYWAVAIPMYLVVCILFGLTVYFCINLIITKPFNSIHTFKDEFSNENDESSRHKYLPQSIPPLEDIPIEVINKLMYQTSKPLNQTNTPMKTSWSMNEQLQQQLLPHSPIATTMKTTTLSNLNTPLNSPPMNTPSSTGGIQKINRPLSTSVSSTRELLLNSMPTSPVSSNTSGGGGQSPRSHYLPVFQFSSNYSSPPINSNLSQSPMSTNGSTSSSDDSSPNSSTSSSSSSITSPSGQQQQQQLLRRVNTLPVLNNSTSTNNNE